MFTRYISLLFVLIGNIHFAIAASGDMTTVIAHDSTELTWYGADVESTVFPDDSKDYQQILMDFTLGCSSGGCSHWDYTVRIEIGEPTGKYDSTIASLDTLSQNPLEIDTVWNSPFEIIEWYELGRMITPYGNYMDYAWGGNSHGFDETWQKTWTYDVTMFEPLLHEEKPVRIFFSGYPQQGRGFSAKVNFRFIEGVPSKRVTNIQKVYRGGGYNNSSQFETDIVPPKTIAIDATYADLKMLITGHGQDGEFTPINYQVTANNTLIREEALWRNDCSENPLSPQGGTWIYNRANWCPGDAVEEHWFELSDYIQNGSIALDVNFDAYTPPNNEANYIISGYIFEYEKVQRLYDVVLEKIVTPSVDSEMKNRTSSTNSTSTFDRYSTTICTHPVVRIKNMGNKTLTYCQIEYGVKGGFSFYYEWTGNLTYGASADVELPLLDWTGLDPQNPEFFAEVSYPNRLVDQFMHNNRKESTFDLPPVFDDGDLTFRIRTNNQAQENSYLITSAAGDTITHETNFSNSSTIDKDLSLQDACYRLVVTDIDQTFFSNGDIGGDGLSYWVNTQNNLESSGYFEIRETGGGRLFYFDPDFGHKIIYEFMVGDSLHRQLNPPLPPSEPDNADVEEVVINGVTYYHMPDSNLYFTEVGVGSTPEEALNIENTAREKVVINVFPNPNNGQMQIQISHDRAQTAQLYVRNVIGQVVKTDRIPVNTNYSLNLNTKASGIYFLQFEIGGEVVTRKVSVAH